MVAMVVAGRGGLTMPIKYCASMMCADYSCPREADVLVVTGPVTHLNRKPLEAIYDAIPNPKLVVAAGSCALMGGVYKNCHGDIPSEEIEGPVDKIIPVDAKVPGCAVRPQDVLAGVVVYVKL